MFGGAHLLCWIRFGGELFHADDTPALIRKQMVKNYYMTEK